MNRYFISTTTLFAFMLALLAGMTACEQEEDIGAVKHRKVPVTIALQTEASFPSTKVAVPNGMDEDGIHTVDVYIYNGIGEELHLTADDFTNGIAQVELTEGPKTIRAVANSGTGYSTPFDACAWITPNKTMPMSTTKDTTWTVSEAQQRYEVRLNRMVAKMSVRVEDERESPADNSIGQITIAGLLQGNTPLYRSGYGEVAETYPGGTNWTGANGAQFYLHETQGTFNVSVMVDGQTRSGNMEAEIPRNHILPLVIHISDYSLVVNVKYQLAAIGTLPVEKTGSAEYLARLPEGCTFKITVTPKKGGGASWSDNATWKIDTPNFMIKNQIEIDNVWSEAKTENITNSTSYTFSGKVSALPVNEEVCEIPITITDGSAVSHLKLALAVRPLEDGELTTTRAIGNAAWVQEVHIDL